MKKIHLPEEIPSFLRNGEKTKDANMVDDTYKIFLNKTSLSDIIWAFCQLKKSTYMEAKAFQI